MIESIIASPEVVHYICKRFDIKMTFFYSIKALMIVLKIFALISNLVFLQPTTL